MTMALTVVLLLAASVWLGGMVAIVVVAVAARRSLDAGARVAFFRALGRAYGVVGGLALLVALGTGAALAADRAWDGTFVAAVVVAAALVACTAVGIAQARHMTRLRRRALADTTGSLAGSVATGARLAAVLRTLIGLCSLALLVLGVLLAS